nr:MAG TPA: hypothetical protein [Caudoviricetes sp.]
MSLPAPLYRLLAVTIFCVDFQRISATWSSQFRIACKRFLL